MGIYIHNLGLERSRLFPTWSTETLQFSCTDLMDGDPLRRSRRQGWLVFRVVCGVGGGGALGRLVEGVLQ